MSLVPFLVLVFLGLLLPVRAADVTTAQCRSQYARSDIPKASSACDVDRVRVRAVGGKCAITLVCRSYRLSSVRPLRSTTQTFLWPLSGVPSLAVCQSIQANVLSFKIFPKHICGRPLPL